MFPGLSLSTSQQSRTKRTSPAPEVLGAVLGNSKGATLLRPWKGLPRGQGPEDSFCLGCTSRPARISAHMRVCGVCIWMCVHVCACALCGSGRAHFGLRPIRAPRAQEPPRGPVGNATSGSVASGLCLSVSDQLAPRPHGEHHGLTAPTLVPPSALSHPPLRLLLTD